MDRNQDVEVELYEENVGNLNYSTPTGSRSSSQDRFPPVLSSQEPTQRRLDEIPFVAIDPRPDPEELSHAPTSQVPRIHDSCHNNVLRFFAIDHVLVSFVTIATTGTIFSLTIHQKPFGGRARPGPAGGA